MNIGQNTFNTEVARAGNSTSKKHRTNDENKESNINVTLEEKNKKGVLGQLSKLNKYKPLPLLDKKGGASRGRMMTPPPEDEPTEEQTTYQMITHTRETNKVPLSDLNSKKNSRHPGKSLPRLIGGLRKLEKMPKNKTIDPLSENKFEKQVKALPKSTSKQVEEKTSKTTVFLKFHSKTMPGYSDGKIKTNQDTVYCNGHVKESKNCALFAAFDGHGMQGHKVSQYLKSQLTGI